MRILLIAANTERISMVALPYGLGLVAAALRQAGHEVAFLDLLDASDLRASIQQAIRGSAPEVIGLSIRNIDDQNRQEPHFLLEKAREVVTACRAASQAPIVLGGPGYSIFPRETLAYLGADYGIRGDGEAAFPALLERLRCGLDPRDLPGIQVAGDRGDTTCAAVANLDRFPLWDEALDRPTDRESPEFWVPVQSRRGCPNDCSYCSTARIQGRGVPLPLPRRVVDAIATLAPAGLPPLLLRGQLLQPPGGPGAGALRGAWRTLAPAVQWRCILYPRAASGEELVGAMAASGCVEASLGFESGSRAILKEMNKRFTPDEVRRISDLLAAPARPPDGRGEGPSSNGSGLLFVRVDLREHRVGHGGHFLFAMAGGALGLVRHDEPRLLRGGWILHDLDALVLASGAVAAFTIQDWLRLGMRGGAPGVELDLVAHLAGRGADVGRGGGERNGARDEAYHHGTDHNHGSLLVRGPQATPVNRNLHPTLGQE